ncbi:MAG: alpha/beta fold hydrolase [Chloroflexota bacterium]|nr:alpha/beta fold hydrolase [Chloroflexota bacterium]
MKQGVCLFIFVVLLAACQSAVPVAAPQTLPATQVIPDTSTPSPVPTIYLSPTPSPTPSADELIFPYTIEGLRQQNFQSGEIQIRSTLSESDRFKTYLIEYPSEGLTITGVMQIPLGEGPFPVILLNHGFYPRGIYSSGDGTDRASAFLAGHGYITLASDYRSWGGSDTGPSLFYSGLVIDVINLLNAIPSIPEADPDRIGMWGHSMGGGVTIKVATIDPRVRAAVLYSPVSADHADIIARWGNGCFGDVVQGELAVGCNSADVVPDDLPQNLQDAYRIAGADPLSLQRVSPFYHLGYVKVPVQIHYGTEDGKFLSGTPPEWSVKLTQGLRDAGNQAELYQYEGEGHSFIGQPWFDFMGRTLRFFDRYLKNPP